MKSRLLLLLVLACSPAYADSIHYTMNFSSSGGGGPTPAGSFLYNHDSPQFSNFNISFMDWTYAFSAIANSLDDDCPNCLVRIHGNPPCLAGQTGAAASFTFLMGGCHQSEMKIRWEAGFAASDVSYLWLVGANPDNSQVVSLITLGSSDVFIGGIGSWTTTATATVPEPSVLALLLTGMIAVACMAWRLNGHESAFR